MSLTNLQNYANQEKFKNYMTHIISYTYVTAGAALYIDQLTTLDKFVISFKSIWRFVLFSLNWRKTISSLFRTIYIDGCKHRWAINRE